MLPNEETYLLIKQEDPRTGLGTTKSRNLHEINRSPFLQHKSMLEMCHLWLPKIILYSFPHCQFCLPKVGYKNYIHQTPLQLEQKHMIYALTNRFSHRRLAVLASHWEIG